MHSKTPLSIFWFRRDLRLEDNTGLYYALKSGHPVLSLFIYDSNILEKLDDQNDKRLIFIKLNLDHIKNNLEKTGSSLLIKYGNPKEVFISLSKQYNIAEIFTNHDYEPYSKIRDAEITDWCNKNRIGFKSFKDQVIFEKNEISKADGNPYTVFTPYMRKWKYELNDLSIPEYKTKDLFTKFLNINPLSNIALNDIGFTPSDVDFPPMEIKKDIIKNYHITRDIPGIEGSSRLSIHLRFGTISIRKLVNIAKENNEIFLNELIWREFYMMILYNFPHVVNNSFKKKYDNIEWLNNEDDFEVWKNGRTGYPIIDAGMKQLNKTGFMHNRIRMITSGFLVKHLLIDWRWGEQYFANNLLDFELSSNNGGWQWSAGSGCDASPYFRIFNPYTQTKKFDPDNVYINKWIPKDDIINYPEPIIDHKLARERAIKHYKYYLYA